MASSAKRSKARKAKIKKAAPPKLRATSVAPVAGPVTLDEAKAIVRAKQPKLAMHAVRKNAAPPTSSAAVATTDRSSKTIRRRIGRMPIDPDDILGCLFGGATSRQLRWVTLPDFKCTHQESGAAAFQRARRSAA